MGLSHETQTVGPGADVTQPKEQTTPDARAMVARSGGDPHALATLVQTHPTAKHAIMTTLQQTLGNSLVRAVVQLLAASDKPVPSSAPTTGQMHVTVDGLNVRRSATKAADNIVGTLNYHDVVVAAGVEGDWVKIEFHGEPAFVFGHYVEPVAPKIAYAPVPPSAADSAEHHVPTPVATAPAPAPASVIAAPAPVVATPSAISAASHHDAPTTAPTDGHVAPAAHIESKKAEKGANKDKTKKKAPPSGYARSAGGATHAVLTRLANEGRLKISPSQIAQLDAASQIESGGKIGSVDTTDDMVVSMGFFQFVLGHKSIEQLMHMAPAAFAKHGLELDPGKTYSFASHPHQIKGVEDYDDLRGPEWGNKFLAASLDDDIIIATAQLALKEAAHVEAITTNAGGKGDFFNDDTARAWLLELHNNRPAYNHVAVEKAVAAGARDAKDRDKFLDVLAAAIEDSYEPEGVTTYHRVKAEAKNKNLTPDQDKELLHKHVAAARLKGTHITQRISRHLALPTLEPIIGPAAHDDKATPVAAAPVTHADPKTVTASVASPPAVTPAAVVPTQGHQAAVSHADTHSTANTHVGAAHASHHDEHAQPSAPAAFDPLDPEYAMVLGQAEAGLLSVDQATAQFAAFDCALHNGAQSVRGAQLAVKLLHEIEAHRVAAVAKKAPSAKPPTEADKPSEGKVADTTVKTQVVPNTTWTPPAGSKIGNQEIITLAAQVHDPRMPALLEHIGGIEKDAKLAEKQTGGGNEMEYTKPEFRDKLVEGIAVVRRELAQLDSAGPGVAAFVLAVNHEIQQLAPYHFQKNIRAIETWDKAKTLGGIRQWSTCNLTSLAMSLETVGISARNFPSAHDGLLATAGSLFEIDLHDGKDDQGGKYYGAQLTGKGVGAAGGHTSVEQIKALRFPDFLEFAAIIHSTLNGKFSHDEAGVIKGAGVASVAKASVPYLEGLAKFMGAKPQEVTLNLGKGAVSFLNDYGAKHRGITAPGVEKMNTARNLMENDQDKENSATNDKDRKKYEKSRASHETDYKSLDKANHKWLEDPEAEQKVPLETYKGAVKAQLGPHIDAGRGVIAGLSGHYVRLYAIDETGIRVQDPGQWNRSEMRITWAEARAMGYFWTNLVIGS